MPTLLTPRLSLTNLDPARDRDGYYRLLADPEVARYIDLEPFTAIEQADGVLASIAQRVASGDALHWAVRLRDGGETPLVGIVNLHCERARRRAEIGYFLARCMWGQGYGAEAVGAVISFVFEQPELNRVEPGRGAGLPREWRLARAAARAGLSAGGHPAPTRVGEGPLLG